MPEDGASINNSRNSSSSSSTRKAIVVAATKHPAVERGTHCRRMRRQRAGIQAQANRTILNNSMGTTNNPSMVPS